MSTPTWWPRRLDVHADLMSTPTWCPHRHDDDADMMTTPTWCPRRLDVHTDMMTTPTCCPRRLDDHADLMTTPTWCPRRLDDHADLMSTLPPEDKPKSREWEKRNEVMSPKTGNWMVYPCILLVLLNEGVKGWFACFVWIGWWSRRVGWRIWKAKELEPEKSSIEGYWGN